MNLLGVVRGCKAFTPILKAQGSGHIVNVASIASLLDVPNMANYNARKAAVVPLSETLHNDLAPHDIRVSVVCPSFFRTNFSDSMCRTVPGMDKSLDKQISKSTLSADDIAQLTLSAIDKQQFYVVPHKEARRLWMLKRLLPRSRSVKLLRKGGKPGSSKVKG